MQLEIASTYCSQLRCLRRSFFVTLNHPSQRHVPALDGLRGIAILLVLGIHFCYSGALPPSTSHLNSSLHILLFGWMGVDLFFVLSGFLITGILLDTKQSPNFFRSFYARRTLRIFPLYYLVIVLGLALTPFLVRFPSIQPSLPNTRLWLAHLVYIQNWWVPYIGHGEATVVGSYWSLGVEEQFYLLWPLLVFRLRTPALTRLCFILCALIPIIRLGILFYHPQSQFVFMSTLTRMDTLLWGALTAILVRSPRQLAKLSRLTGYAIVGSAIGILYIDFVLKEFYSRAFYTSSIGYTIIAIGCAALLLRAYLSSETSSLLARLLNLRLLRAFGKYSYAIYLFHAILIVLMQACFSDSRWYGASFRNAILTGILFLSVTYLAAWLSFHLFEKHFLKLKTQFRAL